MPSTENAIELDSTRWKLQNLENQQVLPGTTITLEFKDGQMKGSAGCNSYGAEYSIQVRNGITFGSIARNLEACIEPEGVMEQEEQYLRALWTITSYRLEEDRLTLLDEHDKALLQYERRPEFQVNPDDLVGRTWQLVSATGFDEESLSDFTIRFDGSEFSGTTACRDYAGNYQTSDDHLNITFLQMTTDFDCDELDGGAEGEYTTLLENVEQYNVSPTTLELYSRRGEKLVFELVTIH
jgi:heat shock protein HslJ